MFIATNEITTREPEKMVERFRQAAPQLKEIEGFLGFEIWKKEGSLTSISRWVSREAFNAYVNSEMFRKQHSRKDRDQEARSHLAEYDGEIIA